MRAGSSASGKPSIKPKATKNAASANCGTMHGRGTGKATKGTADGAAPAEAKKGTGIKLTALQQLEAQHHQLSEELRVCEERIWEHETLYWANESRGAPILLDPRAIKKFRKSLMAEPVPSLDVASTAEASNNATDDKPVSCSAGGGFVTPPRRQQQQQPVGEASVAADCTSVASIWRHKALPPTPARVKELSANVPPHLRLFSLSSGTSPACAPATATAQRTKLGPKHKAALGTKAEGKRAARAGAGAAGKRSQGAQMRKASSGGAGSERFIVRVKRELVWEDSENVDGNSDVGMQGAI